MVRAGVVNHPDEWDMNGYNEIQNPPDRYGVIDHESLLQLCGYSDSAEFIDQHRRWVQEAIAAGKSNRENCWTESIAVGSSLFIEETKLKMGINAKGRSIYEQPHGICVLREESAPYNVNFTPENEALSVENAFFWDNCLTI